MNSTNLTTQSCDEFINGERTSVDPAEVVSMRKRSSEERYVNILEN